MRFLSLTLRDKFLLAFLTLAVILTGMFALLASRISSILPDMSAVQTERYAAQIKLRDMREAITVATIPDDPALLHSGALLLTKDLVLYQNELSLTSSPGAYQSLVFEDKSDLLHQEDDAIANIGQSLKLFDRATQQGSTADAKEALAAIRRATEQLERINTDATHALQASAAVSRRYLITFSMIAVAILLLGILIFAHFLITWITRPLEKIQFVAGRMAEGDFSMELTSASGDELGVLTRSFDDMRRKVLQLNELRDGFISIASHQLRTPLTAIRWLLESLEKSLTEGRMQILPKDKTSLLQAADRTRAMSLLVSSLLTLSRLEADKVKATPVETDLSALLKKICQNYEKQCAEKRIELTVDSDIMKPVRTDPLLVTEILSNLIGNAIKYSRDGQIVSCRVTQKGDQVSMNVHDEGIGISQEDQKQLFTKFFRATNARQHAPDGTGIGLALAQSLASLLGGAITCTSNSKQGTNFILTFPRS